MSLVICGLFSGIGGFELAFRESDGEAKLLCDIDPAARAVLKAKFPHTEIIDDVMALKAFPKGTDIVTAGFPCQNLSMAGDKSGIHGKKSGVVAKLFNLLKEERAPFVLIENVPFMLHLDGGVGMKWLVQSLEARGYKWAYRTLDTMAFGLPQRRRRIYLVASTQLDPAKILFSEWHALEPVRKISIERPIGFFWTEGRSGSGLTQDGLPPIKAGSGIGIRSTPAVLLPNGEVRVPTIQACERLQGLPAHWTAAAAEVDARSRWRLVGNAVSVPVAQWVGRQLMAKQGSAPEGKILKGDFRWPAQAFGSNGKVWAVEIPEVVKLKARPNLDRFTPDKWTRISYRALKGFVDRASAGPLKWPQGFLPALRTELKNIKA